MISCGILSTIFVVFRTFFIGLFTSDPAVYRYAVIRFLFVLMFECLTSSYEISGGCLRGFGRSMTPAILTVFGSCVLRLVWLAFDGDLSDFLGVDWKYGFGGLFSDSEEIICLKNGCPWLGHPFFYSSSCKENALSSIFFFLSAS